MSQEIRVNFKSFEAHQLDKAIKDIIMIVKRSGAKTIGPIPLPTQKRKFCVLRSPHKHKKSREQFEMRIHKRLIYITQTTPVTMDSLMKMEVSPGVKVNIKLK